MTKLSTLTLRPEAALPVSFIEIEGGQQQFPMTVASESLTINPNKIVVQEPVRRLDIRNIGVIEPEQRGAIEPNPAVQISKRALDALNTPSLSEFSQPEEL